MVVKMFMMFFRWPQSRTRPRRGAGGGGLVILGVEDEEQWEKSPSLLRMKIGGVVNALAHGHIYDCPIPFHARQNPLSQAERCLPSF